MRTIYSKKNIGGHLGFLAYMKNDKISFNNFPKNPPSWIKLILATIFIVSAEWSKNRFRARSMGA
jgi:hypothetical protein